MATTLYQAYRDNPQFREQLEMRARELRSAEADRLVFVPLATFVRRSLLRIAAVAMPRRPSFQA